MSSIMVKVVRVPGSAHEYGLEDGATVAEALEAAGITQQSGEQLTVNNEPADLSDMLEDDDRVILQKGAKGNSNA